MGIAVGANENVMGSFERACEKHRDKPAIIYLGESFSYAQTKELVARFATALNDLGVRDKDRVMIYIPNCPQLLIAYIGVQQIGATPVTISPIYTPSEIKYLINDSRAETVLCLDTNFGYVRQVFAKTCLKRIIVTNLADLLPWWKRLIGALLDKIPKGVIDKGEEVYFFKDLINRYLPRPPKVEIISEKHLATLQYTGGTTGFPKGVPVTFSSHTSFIRDLHEASEGFIREGKELLISTIPLFHMLGQQTAMAYGLTMGNTILLMPVPQVDSILETIDRYKATLFIGVPALYRMILENDRLDEYDLNSLRYCWSGGDVLPIQVYNRWEQKFHKPIYQAYGNTEAGPVTQSPLGTLPTQGSIGVPFKSKQIKIVDPDTMEPVPVGKAGELIVTSQYAATSYWNKPEETAESFVEIESKIWYRTRDYVRMDEDGLIYYVDRSADIIKYKGYRVSCSEIEAVLQDYPAVMEACVVGVPDLRVGERIKAMVVLKEDARGVGASELIKWCGERLAPYKIPQYIEFRDMLPKSKVGKLLRREIREEERRRISEEK
jgi:long-chain acyl-CoA synthetase